MPSTQLEIRVSRREADRPRLLQLVAMDDAGRSLGGLAVRVEVDENGTFADEARVRLLELRTGTDGAALFQWFKWPRNGPARDFVSTVTVAWEDESAIVYVEDLYE
jgi:hypothetical protein